MNLLVPQCFLCQMAFPCSSCFVYFREASVVLYLHLFTALHGCLNPTADSWKWAWAYRGFWFWSWRNSVLETPVTPSAVLGGIYTNLPNHGSCLGSRLLRGKSSCWGKYIYSSFCWISLMTCSLLGSYTNHKMCIYTLYCPYTWLTKDFLFWITERMSPEGGTKGWTTNTSRLLLLLFAIQTFSAQSIRGLQLLKGKKKLLTDRDGNTGESAAHKWGLLLALSIRAEMPIPGEGMSLLLARLLSLCSLCTHRQGAIYSFELEFVKMLV